jgi:peptidoglycan/LPS O-acetylase OafA/YrhL
MISPGFHAYVNTPWRMDPLVAGGCLALLVRTRWFVPWLETRRKTFLAATGLLVAVIPLMMILPGILGVLDLLWLACIYTAATAIAVTGVFPALQVPLRGKTLIWLGRHSYGIYMFHQGMAGIIHGLLREQAPQIRDTTDLMLTLLALAATLALAWISMRFMEGPILRAGQRVLYQPAAGRGHG